MERLVIFGKGGIGKSTLATNVSAALALSGKRMLHVGCDPKHDSTVALLEGRMIPAVVDSIGELEGLTPADVVTPSPLGIDCVEAGGPGAGVGCGGRGISRMFEIFKAAGLLEPGRYDVALYDVLGDVVCGGFAAPLRKGIGEKVVIVASEELMALYAANNIARAVVHYSTNGIALAGIVFNLKDATVDRSVLERFAGLINAKVLGYIERDPLVREAEYRRKTVMEYAPVSAIAQSYRRLAEAILTVRVQDCALPTPLDENAFYTLAQNRFLPVDESMAAVAEHEEPVAAEAEPDDDSGFDEELAAGRRAVWLGLIDAEEAVGRLRSAFPERGSTLRASDLVA